MATAAKLLPRAALQCATGFSPQQSFQRVARRTFTDSHKPPGNHSRSVLFSIVGAAALAPAGYFIYTRNPSKATFAPAYAETRVPTTTKTSSDGGQKGIFAPQAEDYQNVYDEIAERLVEFDEYDDGSYGPVVLRLGWHASGTYDAETQTGGSNGATMRFAPEMDHGANAGLKAAQDFLEPVKQEFPWITYSDLWTLATVCAIQEMAGPKIPWRPGRSDRDASWCTPDGRLPDGAKAQDHLRAIFGRMGFNDQEIVALSGAHALGRCHATRSGFEGPWTFSPTMLTNDYYRLLVDEKWEWKKWNGNPQFEDAGTRTLMMLPTDMALVQDEKFRPWVERYAKDGDKFFEDFASVVMKLLELGVPFSTGEEARLSFKSSNEE
ncbi:MAG: hypothetical protein Q9162_001894 [Coniocarpon cinnabarinum]